MRFEDLARRHSAELYRYAYWLARDRQQAEDVVQEALLRAWRAFPGLRDAAAAKSWLFSIVRNEHFRALGRTPPLAQVIDLEDIAAPDGHAALEIREALMALPAAHAEALALQVLGGFSGAEIAALTGSTEGAVMARLTRARQALRRLMEPGGTKERRSSRP